MSASTEVKMVVNSYGSVSDDRSIMLVCIFAIFLSRSPSFVMVAVLPKYNFFPEQHRALSAGYPPPPPPLLEEI